MNCYGNTPLWVAVMNSRGRGEVIRLLLEAEAVADIPNKSGISTRSLAETISNYDNKQFFE